MFQCKHGCQPNFVADANGHIHLVSQPENSNRVEQKAQCTEGLRTCCVACYQPRDTKTDLSVVTNKCCRYMFPISFAVFNLVYWLAFSTWKIKSIWCRLGGRSAELEVSWTSLRYFNLWGRKSCIVCEALDITRKADGLRICCALKSTPTHVVFEIYFDLVTRGTPQSILLSVKLMNFSSKLAWNVMNYTNWSMILLLWCPLLSVALPSSTTS